MRIQLELTDNDLIAIKAEVSAKHWLHNNQGLELSTLDKLGMAVILASQQGKPPRPRKKPGDVIEFPKRKRKSTADDVPSNVA